MSSFEKAHPSPLSDEVQLYVATDARAWLALHLAFLGRVYGRRLTVPAQRAETGTAELGGAWLTTPVVRNRARPRRSRGPPNSFVDTDITGAS